MANIYVVKPKYVWGMLRYEQILPRNGQLLQDMAKIWVGMPKYGQIFLIVQRSGQICLVMH